MDEPSDIDVHERARQDFESANPGRSWQSFREGWPKKESPQQYATMVERQVYLSKARSELLNERAVAAV